MRIARFFAAHLGCACLLLTACASEPHGSDDVAAPSQGDQPVQAADASPPSTEPANAASAIEAPVSTPPEGALPVGPTLTDSPEPLGAPADELMAPADDRSVVGKDTRTPIGDTSSPPFSAVVLLRVAFPDTAGGSYHLCTGTLVSEYAVLTAAHCLHNSRHGGRATSVTAIPGAYNAAGYQGTLQGIGSAGARRIYVPDGFDDSEGYRYSIVSSDYALLWLDRPLGRKAGYRAFGVLPSPLGRYAQMFAYHQDLCPNTANNCWGRPYVMHQSDDKIRRVLPGGTLANHYIDAEPGSSGAGITSDGAEFGRVFAINVSEHKTPDYNRAVLLTDAIVADLRAHLRAP